MDIYQAINQCDFSLFRDSFDRKGLNRVFPLKEIVSKVNILLKRLFCTDQFLGADQLVLNGFVSKVQCLVAMLQLVRSDRQFSLSSEDFPTFMEDSQFASPFLIYTLLNAETADPSDLLTARADILDGVVLAEAEEISDSKRLWLVMSQTLDLLSQAVDLLGRNNFRPPVVMAQHLMAVSLILDKPRLFRVASLVSEFDDKQNCRLGVFGRGLFYQWHLVLSCLGERSDFQIPLAAALTRVSLTGESDPNIVYPLVSEQTVQFCDAVFGPKVAAVLKKKAHLKETRRGRKSQLIGEDEEANKDGEMDVEEFLGFARQVALHKARKVKT